MEQNDLARKKPHLSVLLTVDIVLLVVFLLLGVLLVALHMKSKKSPTDHIQTVDAITDKDLENSISACVLSLSGYYSFGDDSVCDYMTYFCRTDSADSINDSIEAALQALRGNDALVYTLYSGDYDNDGQTEFLFAISDCGSWAKKINSANLTDLLKDFGPVSGANKTVFIYCDVYEDIAVYQFFVADNCTANVTLCVWDSDRLNIETDNGKATFFVCDAESSIGDINFAERYREYLEGLGCRYIHYTNESLCLDGSSQNIFVYGYDASRYDTAVCVINRGRVIPVFKAGVSDNTALYLLNRNSDRYLVTYRNWNSGGTICYEYRKFNFYANFGIHTAESHTVEGKDAENANKIEEFFAKFRAVINNAVVCADPYQLTGYTTTFDRSTSERTETLYLNINNCETSKSGTVTIDPGPNNWLNLRVNPGVSNEKVTVKDGFVKQANGSVVTVLDTVNIDDQENPIWVKAQINYGGEIITGYSSQTYITLPGILHIRPGETFTVTANTNDQGLVWKVNDTAVASIDSSSGTLTGHKHGLVLVTVTSASGLTDSCLVAVD